MQNRVGTDLQCIIARGGEEAAHDHVKVTVAQSGDQAREALVDQFDFHADVRSEYPNSQGEYFSLELTPTEAYELYSQCILPDIADGMGITPRHCFRIRKNAVEMFKEVCDGTGL